MSTPASDKQLAFIKSLSESRVLNTGVQSTLSFYEVNPPSRATASNIISVLINLPHKPKPVAAPAPADNKLAEALAKVEKSFYALPVDDVQAFVPNVPSHGDLMFLEVREYRGNRYMRRLTGAPGRFARWRIMSPDVIALAGIIESDQVGYARLFADHYSVCGCCGAELTDPVSRELRFGPECRKRFGL